MIKMSEGSLDQVLILSGGAKESADPKNFADTNFFVSGAVGSRGTSAAGTAAFGGDTVISGALFTQGTLVRKPTRTVLQSTGSIMSLTSSMNFFAPDSTARQTGIATNTYEMGVTDGEYDGQEVTIMYTGSLVPSTGSYAVWTAFGSGDYVSQVRVGFPGKQATITLAFSTGTPSAINGKTLGLVDTSGAVFSFTGSSSTAPDSPSYDASGKSITYGVNGISTTDEAANSLSFGLSLAIFNGALFANPTLFGGGSGRIGITQAAVGTAGNTSITGTALADGTIGDIGGTNAFAGGLKNPNRANVNYTNEAATGGAYINYKSPTLRIVWDAQTGKWNVLTSNLSTIS